ncbi:MAG: zinc-binding dehydrogenase [Bacteroidetes bacterium]|nr:zinc-binding dehydrogenase [Bacteroidota bacterium]
MKALVLKEKNQHPGLEEVANPKAGQSEVLVRMKAAALNHRDVYIMQGLYPNVRYPLIPGSDGAGIAADDREVIFQPGIHWGDDERMQSRDYHILGLPTNGTFSEYIVVGEGQIFDKPTHLTFEEATALPLAGLTAFRVLFSRCKSQSGEKVLITGAGGGVALFCCQFAFAAGLEVFVTSGSETKIASALKLGVLGAANYKSQDWPEKLKSQASGFDVIIDSAGGDGFADLIRLCNPGGRIGIYGGSNGTVSNFSPQPIFWKQISILGSTMGSDQDFADMLAFVNHHKIVPVVDSVFSLEEGAKAFERMEKGEQFGKIVLRISQ